MASFGVSLSATADTVHKVRFAQTGVVVVWDEANQVQHGSSVTLGQHTQPIPANYVITGNLEPILIGEIENANSKRFSVASNAPISISASAATAMQNVEVRVIETGANASLFGNTFTNAVNIPAGSQTEIFQTIDKTASRAGTPQSQAITLEVTWTGDVQPVIVITALN